MLLQNNTLGPYLNSIVVTLSSTVLALLIGSLAAYALVRIRFQVKLAAMLTFLVLLIAVIVAVAALSALAGAWRSRSRLPFALGTSFGASRLRSGTTTSILDDFDRIMPPIVAVLPIYVMFQRLSCSTPSRPNRDLCRHHAADGRLADARLLRRRAAGPRGKRRDRQRFEVPGVLRHRAPARALRARGEPHARVHPHLERVLLALFLTNAKTQTMPVLVAAQNATRGPQ